MQSRSNTVTSSIKPFKMVCNKKIVLKILISKKIRCFGVRTSKGHTPPPIFSLILSFCPSWEAAGPQNSCLTELRFSWAFAVFLFPRDPVGLRMERAVSLQKGKLPLTWSPLHAPPSVCLPSPLHYGSTVTTGDTTCSTRDPVPRFRTVCHTKNCEKTVKLTPINKTTTILGIPSKIS